MIKTSFCSCKNHTETTEVYDFGMMPRVNNYSSNQEDNDRSSLVLTVCESCKLVQLSSMPDLNSIYLEYDHISSASTSNIRHLKNVAEIINNKHNDRKTLLEVGCNDGTFLRNINKNFISHGIDPAKNVYQKKSSDNFSIHNLFFDTSNQLKIRNLVGEKVDIIIGLNVFAHNSTYNDMFSAIKYLLASDGYAYIEVAYAKDTILSGNFDTIYHEHFCNYTLTSLINILKENELMVVDVNKVRTQGGSLGIWIEHLNDNKEVSENIDVILKEEHDCGISDISMYMKLSKVIEHKIFNIKSKFLANAIHKKVLIVGVPARGVITANVCNFKTLQNAVAIDDTPEKQGYNIPGTNIPIENPEEVNYKNFDIACILAWTYKDDLIKRIKKAGFDGDIFIPFPDGKYI